MSSIKWFTTQGLLFPKENARSNNLDFIRFILAISVMFCHCFVMYYGTEESVEPLFVASRGQASIGTLAVNFFFTISGYLILQSWHKSNNVWDFLKKRIVRIYPAFIVASFLCVFVFAPLGTIDWFQPFGYWNLFYSNLNYAWIAKDVLLLQTPWVPWTLKYVPISEAINASLWTIKYEFICYLLIPILAFARLLRHRFMLPILFFIAYTALILQEDFRIYYFNWEEFPIIGKPDFMPRFVTYFLAGMCFYTYKDLIPRSRLLFGIALVLFAVGLFGIKGLSYTQPILGSYLLFYLAFTQTISFKNFSKAGDFSYGIYVYAWPVQQLVIVFFEKHLNISLLFMLSLMFTLPLAWLSWHYVEKPFLNFKKKKKVVVQKQHDSTEAKVFTLHLN